VNVGPGAEPFFEDAAANEIALAPEDEGSERLAESVLDLEAGAIEHAREGVEREQLPMSAIAWQQRRSPAFVESARDGANQAGPGSKQGCELREGDLRPSKMLKRLEADDGIDGLSEDGTEIIGFEVGFREAGAVATELRPRCGDRPRADVGPNRKFGGTGEFASSVADSACRIQHDGGATCAQVLGCEEIPAEMLSLDPKMWVARVEGVDRAEVRRTMSWRPRPCGRPCCRPCRE
jgi:hypothetical protein